MNFLPAKRAKIEQMLRAGHEPSRIAQVTSTKIATVEAIRDSMTDVFPSYPTERDPTPEEIAAECERIKEYNRLNTHCCLTSERPGNIKVIPVPAGMFGN